MKYILASASPRRKELLSRIINEFEVMPSDFDENLIEFDGDVKKYVENLSYQKALDIKEKINGEFIIIAADTVVEMNNKIFEKPIDETEAFNTLKELSGNIHRVYSGLTVINTKNNKMIKTSLYTEVKFSELTDIQIINYIKTKEPLDKAGSYGIQDLGGVFVEKINGCYYNVVGLPLNLLNNVLSEIS